MYKIIDHVVISQHTLGHTVTALMISVYITVAMDNLVSSLLSVSFSLLFM